MGSSQETVKEWLLEPRKLLNTDYAVATSGIADQMENRQTPEPFG